ncbi:2-enoate reductase [Desulfocicer vacuolatum DSM 3385]|uniref:2-enoate reductase n=1 Tax=Desulfocicer vacuolatum DSM 3385 TaxID=1121400 RepID=A0A1W2EP16_9BACT|nr:FAD-dependent oxidoreductase [Desulfocicer vacuolatum]SMD11463.1 2-enoate reductase [Desulfocicer vacuolatum DSM 3385]
MNEFNVLFQPQMLGKIKLKNRIAMAPMGVEYMTEADGTLNRRVVDYYLERARNGVGMLICSVFKVENQVEHLEESTPMITEASMNYLGDLCDAAHSFGTKIFVQLTAGFGRVTFPSILRGPCMSPSENHNFWDPSIACKALTVEEINSIVTAMGVTARRLALAGVDGIELHGHEGYLFDEFTTPLWNRRTDQYGGSLENRLRFPVECLEEIKKEVGEQLAVVYRFGLKHYLKDPHHGALPGEPFVEVGRDVKEGIEMARELEKAGFDGLHVDAGCYESHYWPHPPIYQKHGCMADMAAQAKAAVSIPVIGVGRLDKPEVAARAVSGGSMDIAAIGRGLLADPQWADKLKFGDPRDIRPCVGCYDGCFEAYSKFRNISCALNPASGREAAYGLTPTLKPLDVMVVGGGIAGMEAARVATLRGHRVTLHEKGDTLGGTVNQAAVPEFKKDLRRLLAWYERQMEKTGVTVKMNSPVTKEKISTQAPDVILVATGAHPMVPPLPGMDQEVVTTAVDLLRGAKPAGNNVMVIGGGLAGCEVAIWLAEKGKKVTVVEMLDQVMTGGASVPTQVKMMTMDLMNRFGVEVLTATRLDHITENEVALMSKDGTIIKRTPDTVALAMGMTPETRLADDLDNTPYRVYRLGDCRCPKNVMNAVWDAYEVARFI